MTYMRVSPRTGRPGPVAQSDACVLFGATGDLALRMLFPSFYHLEAEGRLAPELRIVGVARQTLTPEAFVARVRDAVALRVGPENFRAETWERLAARLDYRGTDVTAPGGVDALRPALAGAAAPLFFLATSPALYEPICSALAGAGYAGGDARVMLEKPIGRDLASSREINAAVGAVFSEDRIYRIDHYLGKETVQNLLALRFANVMFEPLWDNRSIDHVQITIAETEGVGDRWPYYDDYGAARDMLQNHLLQLLALVAMEPPSDMRPDAVRAEKVKVLRSLKRISGPQVESCTVRGQYEAGLVGGEAVAAYAAERGQASRTETFVAVRAEIENWRWAGVPFFLRTGKRMPKRQTQVVVQFRDVPHSVFGSVSTAELVANRLVIDLQPRENIELLLMNKAPGLDADGVDLQPLALSLSLRQAFGGDGGRRRIAYERLLLDAIRGDQTLFVARDEIEEAWAWIDGLAVAWEEVGMAPLPYPAGAWGPARAVSLIERSGRHWND